MTIYRGFSTLVNRKKYAITDYELAKQDLINYFSIKKGEKLMNPNFGSIIWAQLFEPLNETTQSIITSDINRIVGYDPRLRVNSVVVTQENYGLMIEISLSYIPSDQTETIKLNFDKNLNKLTAN